MRNWEATQKHSENLSTARDMLTTIIEYIEAEKRSENLTEGICTWGDAGDSERIIEDLTDLHNRITKQGEYEPLLKLN